MEPRIILDLDLTRMEAGELTLDALPWSSRNPGLARVGSWGGSALGVAILHGERGPAPLVLAVGSAVRRGLPTAARLSVLSRSPLHGCFAEGHIGGDLGPNLAGLADALVLRGRTALPGALLTLSADGSARLESRPELVGRSPAQVWRALRPRGALMSVGLGAELGLPYALLAGGEEYPSFVGRGGLGAVFGALGLKALVIEAQQHARSEPADHRARGLQRALASSPRLAARAAGGSMELYAEPLEDAGRGGRLAREARERAVEQKGCRGCPTPCGWVFERADGRRQKGHFSANRALGSELGLDGFDASLELLSRCDDYGLDAREVGSMLMLLVRAEARAAGPGTSAELFGNPEALARALDGFVGRQEPVLALDPEAFRSGASGLAKRLGLTGDGLQHWGPARARGSSLAGLLGQTVSCGGADPMHSFPFLIDALGRAGLERICRDLAPLPAGAEDPESPVAKGRLVAWHENLVAAVDAMGFCVFSTAGLLADGVSDLESIAAWLLPDELLGDLEPAWSQLAPDQRLLAAGANIVELRRSLDRRYRAMPLAAHMRVPESLSDEMRGWLDQPGMLAEYRACRRDDERTELLAEPLVARHFEFREESHSSPTAHALRKRGQVELQAGGLLGEALGAGCLRVSLDLPATLPEVLRAACELEPRLGRQLFMGPLEASIPLPSAWRAGRRLREHEELQAGDVLLLISVIAGG